MRFSFLQGFNRSIENIVSLQAQNFNTQNQIATGKRILTPADDPVASARIIQINQQQTQLDQYIANADSIENRLALEETLLQSATSVITRVRELTIQAGGLGITPNDREGIAVEIDTRLNELVSLANTRDTNGEYIFSGFKGSVKPFEQSSAGDYVYLGDDGQRLVSIASSTTIPISDSGKDIFVDIPSAVSTLDTSLGVSAAATISSATINNRTNYDANANYPEDYVIQFTGATTFNLLTRTDFLSGTPFTPVATGMTYSSGATIDFDSGIGPAPVPGLGFELTITGTAATNDTFFINTNQTQSVMTTFGQLSEGLKTLTDSPADTVLLEALLANTLTNLDAIEANFSQAKSQIGARQNTVESVRALNVDVSLVNQEVLSEIRDLDYAEAISRLSLETFTLEAAQQSFARISGLSLFNFL
ncbi:MAG: flagellar hook-associated protein FlgL [Spongiibacteraceae bacterium]|nr:flagellar hook-associated protein FlgL [Spongiibacteraceae bacterium]